MLFGTSGFGLAEYSNVSNMIAATGGGTSSQLLAAYGVQPSLSGLTAGQTSIISQTMNDIKTGAILQAPPESEETKQKKAKEDEDDELDRMLKIMMIKFLSGDTQAAAPGTQQRTSGPAGTHPPQTVNFVA